MSLRRALWHLRHGGLDALKEHRRRERATDSQGTRLWRPRHGKNLIPDWLLPDAQSLATHPITAAVIADEFTRLALAYEWNMLELSADAWYEELTSNSIDLVFIESAWHGNNDQWRYQVIGKGAPGQRLKKLIVTAQELGIPVVLWNKEDPVHFEDSIATAQLVDYVFTTDSLLVSEYERILGHARVGVLPFAAQPLIHNPIRVIGSDGRPVPRRGMYFAGMYFTEKYPQRRQQMDTLLSAARQVSKELKKGVDIYSRYLGGDKKYQFPPEFSAYIRGSLTYQQMLCANRLYLAAINVNSVVDSPSMCARRIFEVSACNTPVVTMDSPAIGNFFPQDTICVVSDGEEARQGFRRLCQDTEYGERMTHKAQREIWLKHTYTERIDRVLRAIGRSDALAQHPTVAPFISTMRPELLDNVVDTLVRQEAVDMQPIVLTHGFEVPARVRDDARQRGLDIQWLSAPESHTLGHNYAQMLQHVDADFIAKMDDDDVYGDYYLFESLMAAHFAQAEVVGKHAHYMYLAGLDRSVLRFPEWEHRFSSFVSGPTIVARTDIAREVGFQAQATGEDTVFLRGVSQCGGKIYSASRFGFIQRRGGVDRHTWMVAESDILRSSQYAGRGVDYELIFP